jgi:hypothetical protein
MVLRLSEGQSQSATHPDVCFVVAQIVEHGLEPHWKDLGVVFPAQSLSLEFRVVSEDLGADCSESQRGLCAEIGAQA